MLIDIIDIDDLIEQLENARDTFIIHMAVIEATYDMDSALDSLAKIFRNRSDME